MKRIILTVADRFFLLRPLVLVPAITFFLLGYYGAGGGMEAGHSAFLVAAICYALLMGSVYIVNQIADIETDRVNDKLFLLPKGIIKRREAVILAVVLSVLSMGGAFLVDGVTPLYFCLSLLVGLAYSIPPVSLKRRFPFDLLSNSLGYGVLAYATGWSVVTRPGGPALENAVPFALCVGGVFIHTALADREGDARSGFRSTGVVLTPAQGAVLGLCLVAVALPVALVVENRVAAVGSVLSLPFFAYAALRVGPRSGRIAYRGGSAVFVLIVGLLHPAFLVVVLAALGLARLYYSRRFSLSYPSIAGR
jgi:4-hydroxybenzoate polyprenyltransferase